MFIQLTRLDGSPVWLNASFIVTVEPSRGGGGAIVVPIGDGLDYDVREKPEEVLQMLDGAPPVKVVPVPPPKTLTVKPDDVSYESAADLKAGACSLDATASADATEGQDAPKRRVRRTKSASKKGATASAEPEKGKSAPGNAEAQMPAAAGEAADEFQRIVAGLKGRKCRTVKRMRNAIKSFYGKKDDSEIDGMIESMLNGGYLAIEQDGHVNWIN